MKKGLFLVILTLLQLSGAFAQEGTWNVIGSAGVAALSMRDVERDNQNDINGWNLYENIPIGSFQPFDYAFSWSVSGSYRFDRDWAVTFGITDFKKEVAASYRDARVDLELRRTVGSMDFMAGLAYFFPPAIQQVETYFLLELGLMNSRATAEALGSKTEKINDSTYTYTTYDTHGVYDKSKLIVNVGVGATSQMFEPLFMRVQATYKMAKIGKIDGEVTQFGATVPHTTSIDFDYSSFLITIGFGISF